MTDRTMKLLLTMSTLGLWACLLPMPIRAQEHDHFLYVQRGSGAIGRNHLLLPIPTLASVSDKVVQPLTISIVIPDGISGDAIELGEPTYHFDVVVENVSDKAQWLWDYNCSWGFSNVYFEVVAVDGKSLTKPIEVTRGIVMFDANSPMPRLLPRQGLVVQEIHLYQEQNESSPGKFNIPSGDIYMNFPLPKKGDREQVSLRAFFEIPSDVLTKKYGIWTGSVVSEVKEYTVFWKS